MVFLYKTVQQNEHDSAYYPAKETRTISLMNEDAKSVARVAAVLIQRNIAQVLDSD